MDIEKQLDGINNIEDLKDIITEDQLLLVYWYISNKENELSSSDYSVLYDLLSKIDDKFFEDE
jgi:hypothetical protein